MDRFPAFYPVLDTRLLAGAGIDVVDAAAAVLDAGAQIVQLRHKEHFSRAMFEAAERIAALCGDADASFVINDRSDIAMLLGAGVHVGQDDLEPSDVRRLMGPRALIGYSTHNEAQLRAAAAEPADYVALGPIFGTTSKEHPDPVVGTEELARLRPFTDRALVAIGGITRANARDVIRAGADSVAVIGDLLGGSRTASDIRASAEEWVRQTAGG